MPIVILACISAVLYRIGGSALKIPLKTKFRDWGCPACGVLAMIAMHVQAPWWAHLAYFGLGWASLVSYFDHWGTDGVDWFEWLLTGCVMGLAAIPYAFATGLWLAFWVQFAAQVGLFMAVRCLSENVYVEECGSGASIVMAKIPFFLFKQ